MNRRWTALPCSIACLVLLAACGNKGDGGAPVATSQPTTSPQVIGGPNLGGLPGNGLNGLPGGSPGNGAPGGLGAPGNGAPGGLGAPTPGAPPISQPGATGKSQYSAH